MTAPVQVLVVGFDAPSFSGEVLDELQRLREQGIVRLVDLLVVSRAPDGTLETLPVPPELGAGAGALATALLARADDEPGDQPGAPDRPVWSLADVVPPGSVAAVALIEHLWAAPLRAAIQRAGGSPLDETWLAPDDLARLAELTAARAG